MIDLLKTNVVILNIPLYIPEFIDEQDNIHVVQLESGIFQMHAKNTYLDVLEVMKFCMTRGDEDTTRRTAENHKVMNVKIKAELETNGIIKTFCQYTSVGHPQG